MDFLYIAGGFLLLFAGGETLLRGSVALAERYKLSKLLIGMVIVGFGTSLPELIVSVTAATGGVPDLALGNVVGSNIANVLLILGVSAAINQVSCGQAEISRDTLAVLAASVLVAVCTFLGSVPWFVGAGMVFALIGYLVYAYRTERTNILKEMRFRGHVEEDIGTPSLSLMAAILACTFGLFCLPIGADLLVEGSTSIALRLGIPDAVIGLTIVAVGTSLPELATALVAAYRGHGDVVIGNIVGSNLFNILGVLGATSVVAPVPMEGRIASTDVWVMLGVAGLLYVAARTDKVISRREGALFLVLFVIYVAWAYIAVP